MSYEYYISPEDYERAAYNGIKRGTLDWRVRVAAWGIEQAVRIPPRKLKNHSEWIEIAAKNGIPYQNFINRVSLKWTPERAATQPLLTNEKRAEQMKKQNPVKRNYPEELIKQAASNGVSRNTFYARVRNGWDWERAASEPLVSSQECGRRGIESVYKKYGNINALIFQKRG
ncbi:hypothetical protein MHB77_29345 [Paenibacillus sp. FSL K6-3166]|uniref:hypothetical protein n=1 Tax=unclassified Paenibacillus TaxID=185978 RepID=UPI000BA0EAD8|nr:hypothetical protein [Paenibacillus sp. VTT E-133291]OZQ95832.1 hypothetical protein CA598_08360 [Paenibacillus sp. VTT E-133291]